MYRILSILLLSIIGSSLQAQFSDSIRPYPDKQLQVAMGISDLVAHRVRLETSYRFDHQNAIGLGVADLYGDISLDNHLFNEGERPIDGYFLSASHKYYLYGSYTDRYMFMRSSLNFQHSSIRYETTDWVSYEENGNTLWMQMPVDKNYRIDNLGINFEIGFEVYYQVWFMELSVGASYNSVLSERNRPLNAGTGRKLGDIDYEGLRPVIGYRIGAYIF